MIEQILDHIMKGVIFHIRLSEYYNFISLDGFSDFHAHQAKEEFCSSLKVQRYYMDNQDKLIPAIEFKPSDSIIPEDWYSHIKKDVDTATVRQGTKFAFDKWLEWDTQTKQFYEENYKTATGCEKGILEKLIKDVTKEICEAKKEYMKLKISDYNIEVILKMQDKK